MWSLAIFRTADNCSILSRSFLLHGPFFYGFLTGIRDRFSFLFLFLLFGCIIAVHGQVGTVCHHTDSRVSRLLLGGFYDLPVLFPKMPQDKVRQIPLWPPALPFLRIRS